MANQTWLVVVKAESSPTLGWDCGKSKAGCCLGSLDLMLV